MRWSILLVVAGCALSPSTPSYWPGDETWQTSLEPGDYVVYRYTGSFTPMPVLLKQEVVERRRDRLVIDVVATRGEERRHWIEVVAGAKRDVKPARVDELYEVDGATRRRLANPKNQDLDRLYDWTVAMPDRASTSSSESASDVFHEGWRFACTKIFGETVWNGATVKVSSTRCPLFPWSRWEHGVWTEDHTLANVEVVETGRGGYAQITCPDGTTRVRRKDFDAIEETCTRPDGVRHGLWHERDGHGHRRVWGRYVNGEKHGLWTDRKYGDVEQCMFDDGAEVGYARPLDWTHLRLGAGLGGGHHVGTGEDVVSVVAQVGWDLWSPRQHCYRLPIRKQLASTSVAAIADLHLFANDDDATALLRLGLQGYAVKHGFLPVGFFASTGAIVSPRLGVGTSIGIELILFRLEARYDYLGSGDHLLSFNVGASDGLLAVFD